jgi:hypothetical protein
VNVDFSKFIEMHQYASDISPSPFKSDKNHFRLLKEGEVIATLEFSGMQERR